MNNKLSKNYALWRKEIESFIKDGDNATFDCGLAVAREDFSNYAELPKIIKFQEMLKLEHEYENNN